MQYLWAGKLCNRTVAAFGPFAYQISLCPAVHQHVRMKHREELDGFP
jgi:hypothetical protein